MRFDGRCDPAVFQGGCETLYRQPWEAGMQGFHRKYIEGPGMFFGLLSNAIRAKIHLERVQREERISAAFGEKIMLAVAMVNGCRDCTYIHAQALLEEGVAEVDIKAILKDEFGDFPARESSAILYAQHLASGDGQASETARRTVAERHGETFVRQVECYVAIITLGNMSMATPDAFKSGAVAKTMGLRIAHLLTSLLNLLKPRRIEDGKRLAQDSR